MGMYRAACALIIGLCSSVANAKVANISYAELAKWSDVIAVGQVQRIDVINGRHFATVDISRSIKGARSSVRYVADRTWACDISKAVMGETCLFFLSKDRSGDYVIAHAGRGRIPLTFERGSLGAPVRRYTMGAQWELNLNLWAPKAPPILKGPLHGFLRLDQLIKAITRPTSALPAASPTPSA